MGVRGAAPGDDSAAEAIRRSLRHRMRRLSRDGLSLEEAIREVLERPLRGARELEIDVRPIVRGAVLGICNHSFAAADDRVETIRVVCAGVVEAAIEIGADPFDASVGAVEAGRLLAEDSSLGDGELATAAVRGAIEAVAIQGADAQSELARFLRRHVDELDNGR